MAAEESDWGRMFYSLGTAPWTKPMLQADQKLSETQSMERAGPQHSGDWPTHSFKTN